MWTEFRDTLMKKAVARVATAFSLLVRACPAVVCEQVSIVFGQSAVEAWDLAAGLRVPSHSCTDLRFAFATKIIEAFRKLRFDATARSEYRASAARACCSTPDSRALSPALLASAKPQSLHPDIAAAYRGFLSNSMLLPEAIRWRLPTRGISFLREGRMARQKELRTPERKIGHERYVMAEYYIKPSGCPRSGPQSRPPPPWRARPDGCGP